MWAQHTRNAARQRSRSRLFVTTEELEREGSETIRSTGHDMAPDAATPGPGSDFEAVINVVVQLAKTASPEQLAILRTAVGNFTNHNDSSDFSLSSPTTQQATSPLANKMIRRRSLFSTPGVASREPKSPGTLSPKTKKAHTQTWSPDMFTASPLSRIAGWESHNDGQTEKARPLTPDVSTLGTHKLGSLRVINGAASPAPSILEKAPCPESSVSRRLEDYFTASEGSGRTSPGKVIEDDASEGMEARSPRSDSGPVSLIDGGDRSEASSIGHRDSPALEHPVTTPGVYSLEAASNPFVATESALSPACESNAPRLFPTRTTRSERDSLDLRGPSTTCQPISSEHVAGAHSMAATAEGRGVVLETTAGRTNRSSAGALSASSSVYSSASHRKPIGSSRQLAGKRPKFDSGYASCTSISLITINSGTDSEDPVHGEGEEEKDSNRHVETTIPHNQETFAAHRQSLPATLSCPSTIATGTREDLRPSAADTYTVPAASYPQVDSESPNDKPHPQGGNSPSPRKLRKRRPISLDCHPMPLIVQTAVAERTNFDGLPRIPSKVSKRYSERMIKHPDMENLERTFKSVSHSNSRESLSTLDFSVIAVEFVDPSHKPDAVGRGSRRSRSREAKRSGEPRSASRRRFFRSGSRNRDDSELGASSTAKNGARAPDLVTDFGTVAASLGSSPYDPAMMDLPSRYDSNGRSYDGESLTHPYQLGRASRSRRRTGMSDQQASQYAIQRSRDHNYGANAQCDVSASQPAVSRESEQLQPTTPDSATGGDFLHEAQLRGREHIDQSPPRIRDRQRFETARPPLVHRTTSPDGEESRMSNLGWERSASAWRRRREGVVEDLQHVTNLGDGFTERNLLRERSAELHPLQLGWQHREDAHQLSTIPAAPSRPAPAPPVF